MRYEKEKTKRNQFYWELSMNMQSIPFALNIRNYPKEREKKMHIYFVRFNATQNDNELLTMARHEKASFPIKWTNHNRKKHVQFSTTWEGKQWFLSKDKKTHKCIMKEFMVYLLFYIEAPCASDKFLCVKFYNKTHEISTKTTTTNNS